MQGFPAMTRGLAVIRGKPSNERATTPPLSIQRARTSAEPSRTSIHPRLWLDVLHLVRHRVGVHRAVVDGYAVLGLVEPGKRVLHPVLVVALGEILAGV